MRFILAAALFCVCAYIGYAKDRTIRRRLHITEGFLTDIKQLGISMRYKMRPLKELIGELEGSGLDAFWKAFLKALGESPSLNDAWQSTFKAFMEYGEPFSCLTEAQTRILLDFGAGLGTSDITAQRGNMELALERLNAEAEAIRAEVAKKGKVFKALGVLGGLAAAIVVW